MIYDLLHSTGQDLQLPIGIGHKRTSRSHTYLIPPYSHTKATATGSPYTFLIVRRFFYVPQKLSTFNELWDGTSSLASLSQMTRKMKCTRAALSPQLFKDPECWSGRSLTTSRELTTSRVTARCTTKWATVVVMRIKLCVVVVVCLIFLKTGE